MIHRGEVKSVGLEGGDEVGRDSSREQRGPVRAVAQLPPQALRLVGLLQVCPHVGAVDHSEDSCERAKRLGGHEVFARDGVPQPVLSVLFEGEDVSRAALRNAVAEHQVGRLVDPGEEVGQQDGVLALRPRQHLQELLAVRPDVAQAGEVGVGGNVGDEADEPGDQLGGGDLLGAGEQLAGRGERPEVASHQDGPTLHVNHQGVDLPVTEGRGEV